MYAAQVEECKDIVLLLRTWQKLQRASRNRKIQTKRIGVLHERMGNMDIPFGGNVSVRLVRKLFKDKVFYYVREIVNGRFEVVPCVLSNIKWDINFPFVRCLYYTDVLQIDSTYTLHHQVKWENLYSDFMQAKDEAERRNHIYDCFRYKPFLELRILQDHLTELMAIEAEINNGLAGFENFEGIDFCDIGAGGITIRGHHKQIDNIFIFGRPKIKYDFSNTNEVIKEFINMWKREDTPEEVASTLDFLRLVNKLWKRD